MFKLRWTQDADVAFKQLRQEAKEIFKNRAKTKRKKSSLQEGIYKQAHKTVTLLSQNPKHPSLNTHAYYSIEHPFSKQEKVFEAYAQNNTAGAYRVFWCYGPCKNEITIIAITRHP